MKKQLFHTNKSIFITSNKISLVLVLKLIVVMMTVLVFACPTPNKSKKVVDDDAGLKDGDADPQDVDEDPDNNDDDDLVNFTLKFEYKKNIYDVGEQKELHDAHDVAVTELANGNTVAYVASYAYNGVTSYQVGDDGTLTQIQTIADADKPDSVAGGEDETGGEAEANQANNEQNEYQLKGSVGVTIAKLGTSTYLYVCGRDDDGISVFQIGSDGKLTWVQSIDKSLDASVPLDGPWGSAVAEVGDANYLFVASTSSSSLTAFKINNQDGSLIFVDAVVDNEKNFELGVNVEIQKTAYMLKNARAVTTARVGSKTYVFVSSPGDGGISMFEFDPTATVDIDTDDQGNADELIWINSVSRLDYEDSTTWAKYRLKHVVGISTMVSQEGKAFLFAAGQDDNAVTVFKISTTGLEFVDSKYGVQDNQYNLTGAKFVEATEVNGKYVLLVSSKAANNLNLFEISDSGKLTWLDEISKASNDSYKLQALAGIDIAKVKGSIFVFTVAEEDRALNVIELAKKAL